MQAGFFLAPIIYPLEILPERFHFYLYVWPPTPIIEFSRAVLVRGVMPTPTGHLYLAVDAVVLPGRRHRRVLGGSARARRSTCSHAAHRSRAASRRRSGFRACGARPMREHVLGLLQPRRFQRLQVLDGVSFDVRRGEALGIMGRNGSGKSTLLKIMCGIYPARPGPRQHARGDHADPRARRRLESRARRHRQRAPDRLGHGAVARARSAGAWTRFWRSPSSSASRT